MVTSGIEKAELPTSEPQTAPPPQSRESKKGVATFFTDPVLQIVSVVGGIAAWELVARIWELDFLPPASEVFQRVVELFVTGEVLQHIGTSLQNLALAYAISVVVGVAVGVCMAWFPIIEAALEPYVYAFFTAPVLVFAPIFMSLFGLGREAIVGVIILYTIFMIIINTCAGVKSVSRELIEMGTAFNASQRQLLWLVAVPAASPMIMAGLRLGMGRAVKGMINGEMFIAVLGLGGIVRRAGTVFDSTQVLAIVMVILIVALVLNGLLSVVDRRVTGWLPSVSR